MTKQTLAADDQARTKGNDEGAGVAEWIFQRRVFLAMVLYR